MNGNKTAIWTLAGVGTGFLLPFLGFFCMIFFCMASLFGMSAMPGTIATGNYEQVSGPASGPAIAIIDINGVITSGSAGAFGSSQIAATDDIVPLIHQAAQDEDIRAILLMINSPGGSVVASDEIYHALIQCGKPIVVYMGETAASGGYYISMAAEHIVANPNTLTGSIGVISEFPEASVLMEELGISVTVVKSGKVKDIGSLYRPMTKEEEAYWQALIDEVYAGFVDIVAEGRDLPRKTVLEIADGRVFTGKQALALRLIDSLGYPEDAVSKAAELGGIADEPRIIRLMPTVTFSSLLSSAFHPALPSMELLRDALMPRLQYRWAP